MVPVRIRALLIAGVLASAPLPAQDAAVVVVVNAMVHDSLDRAMVRRIFLARQRFWDDGTPVRPVNLGARSELRDLFSQRALGAHPREFTDYWNDLWFHGTSPPPTLASDQAVLMFVARTRGAIGYVSEAAARAPPAGVRIAIVLTR